MGTSIYPAFKLRHPLRLWPVVGAIKQTAQANIVAKLRALYWDKLIRQNPDSEAFKKKAKGPSDWFARLDMIQEGIKKAYQKAALSNYKDNYNFDVTLAVTTYQGDYFLRPFCDYTSHIGGSLDFLETDPHLQDFHYQNKTDKPDSVSEKAWSRRERTWDAMLDKTGYFKDQLVVEICNWDIYRYRLDPWLELSREYHRKPPRLPCQEAVYAKDLRSLKTLKFARGRPGQIELQRTNGDVILIQESPHHYWYSTVKGQRKKHASLDKAVDYVMYPLLPPYLRRLIDEARSKK